MTERDALLARPPRPGLQRSFTEEFARLGSDQEVFTNLVSGTEPEETAEDVGAGATARERNRAATGRNVADLRRLQTRETFVALLVVLSLLMVICTLVSVVYYWYAWLVIVWYQAAPCDQPLLRWLLVYLLLELAAFPIGGTQSPRVRALKVLLMLATPCWLVYGAHLYAKTEACFPALEYFIFTFLCVEIGTWLLKSVLFVLVFLVAMWFIDLNLVRSQRAAGRKLVDTLQQVPFSRSVFSDAEDAKAPPECSICQEDFCDSKEPDKQICVTPCGHYFHSVCLGEWFERDRVCPLCRHDIAASKGMAEP